MTRHLPHVQRQLPCLYNHFFLFDAFIYADSLSWAHQLSCIQTTWILSQGENWSVWCIHRSCGLLSLHLSLTAALCLCRAGLHCKHFNEPLLWYSSHQCSTACFSFFLHELCNLSTWSYPTWLCLNSRFTRVPLYYTVIHTAGLPRCANSTPLLLARTGILQEACFAIERV